MSHQVLVQHSINDYRLNLLGVRKHIDMYTRLCLLHNACLQNEDIPRTMHKAHGVGGTCRRYILCSTKVSC